MAARIMDSTTIVMTITTDSIFFFRSTGEKPYSLKLAFSILWDRSFYAEIEDFLGPRVIL